jgi:serine/threonine-protein kinase
MMSSHTVTIAARELYILPDDVLITPVHELPSNVRAQLQFAEEDFAITRPGSRVPSKVIDKATVDILHEFRSPIIKNFLKARLLVSADSDAAKSIQPTLKIGKRVEQFEIVKPIQAYEDVEVYQVISTDNMPLAFKIARRASDQKASEMIAKESEIIQKLDGKVNPKFWNSGFFDNRLYFTAEWFSGAPVTIVAQEYRNLGILGNQHQLISLCSGIARAYAHLHDQGIIHSDVHPRNVLLNRDGMIKIIDYGLARFVQTHETKKEVHRGGGIAYFFEPEYASARLHGLPLPACNTVGEQYCVATLLYYLITGKHYLQFSLEKHEMLRQIEEDAPLPFEAQKIQPWPQMERVLGKALSKKPTERFLSLWELAEALENLTGEEKSIDKVHTHNKILQKQKSITQQFVRLIEKISHLDTDIPNDFQVGPTASVVHGAAGIAYTLYRLSCLKDEPELLSMADVWNNHALSRSQNYEGFFNDDIQITPKMIGPISLYYNISGIHCVQAMISYAMGDEMSMRKSIEDYVTVASIASNKLDLNFGYAGILLGCSLLMETVRTNEQVQDLGNKMLSDIWTNIDKFDAIGYCPKFSYLGMAHGWAGVLYATLRWCQITEQPFPPSFQERLTQLAQLAEPWGRGLRWKMQQSSDKTSGRTDWTHGLHGKRSSAKYVSWWCNGSAGLLHLWILACKVFGDDAYFKLAEGAAWNTWEDEQGSGDLCCGFAGRTYALINFYKHTGEQQWLQRAKDLAIRATTVTGLEGVYVFSLYKGALGVALLLEDLEVPESACMPFFEKQT